MKNIKKIGVFQIGVRSCISILILMLCFSSSVFAQTRTTSSTQTKSSQAKSSQSKNSSSKNQPVRNQSLTTAPDFFQQVSEKYASISQYEANIKIDANKVEMEGTVSFKKPSMLRIDFTQPENQVVVYNGTELLIYLPRSSAVLRQNITVENDQNAASNAAQVLAPTGLSLMSRYYSVQYENGPNPEPIDSENPKSKKVIKLLLTRKNNAESFRTMNIAIDPKTLLIVSIDALTTNDETFSFLFEDYIINEEIPDTRFLYDIPPDANEYNNFLFTE